MEVTEKQKRAFDEIGKATGKPNLLQQILGIGKKRTEMVDALGVTSKQAVLKTEDGYEYPEKCYLYVPDSEQVSTWKLRICAPETTEVTREQLGAAAAAFSPGGFRGQKVELPSEDVAQVKEKLREEYAKLGVELADMPEGIKVKEISEKFALAVKACTSETRKKMTDVLAEMEKEDADNVALVRQLAELVAQVQDETLRNQLTELVNVMLEMYSKPETETEVVETEMDVEEIAKALKLKELSDLLESHNSLINETSEKVKSFDGVVAAISELVDKNKQLFEKVTELEKQLQDVKQVSNELAKEDETKIAEKAQRFTPFWGSGMQASKAVTTVLTDEKAASLAKPEVPNVIQKMSRKAMGGK